jgi:uncharacterized protein YjbI with pentapeptide repeats
LFPSLLRLTSSLFTLATLSFLWYFISSLLPYLKDANLTNAKLHNADLSRARLKRANLTKAQLHGANLHGADLRWANLCEAQLDGVNMDSANLIGADCSYASLQGVNLSWTNLSSTIFAHADLTGADFTGANLSDTDMHNAKLCNALLIKARLLATNLEKADLTEADLRYSWLSDAILIHANLTRAEFGRSTLCGANLESAILLGANLSGANLLGASLIKADLSNACLTRANLVFSDTTGANLQNVNISLADLLGTQLQITEDSDINQEVLRTENYIQDKDERLLDSQNTLNRLLESIQRIENIHQGFNRKPVGYIEMIEYLARQIESAKQGYLEAKKILEYMSSLSHDASVYSWREFAELFTDINRFICYISKYKRILEKISLKPRNRIDINTEFGSLKDILENSLSSLSETSNIYRQFTERSSKKIIFESSIVHFSTLSEFNQSSPNDSSDRHLKRLEIISPQTTLATALLDSRCLGEAKVEISIVLECKEFSSTRSLHKSYKPDLAPITVTQNPDFSI